MEAKNRDLKFRKSSFSQYVWNQCVEVAIQKDLVVIRDSKDPDGVVLEFTPNEWRAFVEGVKNKEFDSL